MRLSKPFLATCLYALALGAWADSSGTAPPPPREWRDESGKLLKRLDSRGRSTFFTRDEAGRVVRIDCDKDVWTHCFFYGAEGLIAEVDCAGRRHEFDLPREIDLKAGTALGAHQHLPSASPVASTVIPVQTRFEYDSRGKIRSGSPVKE